MRTILKDNPTEIFAQYERKEACVKRILEQPFSWWVRATWKKLAKEKRSEEYVI
jgi:hypothetical protein